MSLLLKFLYPSTCMMELGYIYIYITLKRKKKKKWQSSPFSRLHVFIWLYEVQLLVWFSWRFRPKAPAFFSKARLQNILYSLNLHCYDLV